MNYGPILNWVNHPESKCLDIELEMWSKLNFSQDASQGRSLHIAVFSALFYIHVHRVCLPELSRIILFQSCNMADCPQSYKSSDKTSKQGKKRGQQSKQQYGLFQSWLLEFPMSCQIIETGFVRLALVKAEGNNVSMKPEIVALYGTVFPRDPLKLGHKSLKSCLSHTHTNRHKEWNLNTSKPEWKAVKISPKIPNQLAKKLM